MAEVAVGVPLNDILFEEEHPFILKSVNELVGHSGVEVFQPPKKKPRTELSPAALDEPDWYQDRRDAYAAEGLVWKHPNLRSEVGKMCAACKWAASLPPREKCVLWFMLNCHPHEGDTLPLLEALERYDEFSCDLSQEIGRAHWKNNAISCLTKSSVVFLRFRRRLMNRT